jgi:hypothetical protein
VRGDEAGAAPGCGGRNGLARERFHRAQTRRQRTDDRLAERAVVVARQKAHQFQPLRRQARRIVAQRDDSFHPACRQLARDIAFDDDADSLPRAERHHNAIADTGGHLFRRGVIEKPRERHVERHPHARNRAVR